MKKLAIYLQGKKRQQVAKAFGVTQRTMEYWLSGSYAPNVRTAIRVERVTKGFISVYDWA